MESVSDKVENILSKLDDSKTENKENTVENTSLNNQDVVNMEEKENLELNKLNEKYLRLEKELISLKAENNSLNNVINGMKENKLVNKALELNKKLDPNTTILDADTLKKELKTLHPDSTDFLLSLESYNNGLEIALSKIPQGDLPRAGVASADTKDGYSSEMNKLIAEMNEMGTRR